MKVNLFILLKLFNIVSAGATINISHIDITRGGLGDTPHINSPPQQPYNLRGF
jgi:hypothetical protein